MEDSRPSRPRIRYRDCVRCGPLPRTQFTLVGDPGRYRLVCDPCQTKIEKARVRANKAAKRWRRKHPDWAKEYTAKDP